MLGEESTSDILFRIMGREGGSITFVKEEYPVATTIEAINIGPEFKWICTYARSNAEAMANALAGYFEFLRKVRKNEVP